MRRPSLLLLPFGLALVLAGTGCGDTTDPVAGLVDDAAVMAAISDGDGEDLSASLASLDFDAAVEEDVDVELVEGEELMARECRLVDFRRRVIDEFLRETNARQRCGATRRAMRSKSTPPALSKKPNYP